MKICAICVGFLIFTKLKAPDIVLWRSGNLVSQMYRFKTELASTKPFAAANCLKAPIAPTAVGRLFI